MDKFVIYHTGKEVMAQKVGGKATPEAIDRVLAAKGFRKLREIAGKNESDALAQYDKAVAKAAKLRQEGETLRQKVATPEAIQKLQEETQAKEDSTPEERTVKALLKKPIQERLPILQTAFKRGTETPPSMEDLYIASSYAPEATAEYAVTGEFPLMTAVLKDAPNLLQRFAYSKEPSEKEEGIVGGVITDPTAVPGLAMPAFKAPGLFEKGAGLIDRLLPRVQNALAQSFLTEAPDIATGGASASDVLAGTAAGSTVDLAGSTLGKGLREGGSKIIKSLVKDKNFTPEALMGAKTVAGKNVVKAGSTLEGVSQDIDAALKEWQAVQSEALKGNVIDNGDVIAKFKELKGKYADLRDSGSITDAEYAKKIAILDEEMGRFENAYAKKVGTAPLDRVLYETNEGIELPEEVGFTPKEMFSSTGELRETIPTTTVHNARVAVGPKSKFQLSDASTADPTRTETYRDLYKGYHEMISGENAPQRYVFDPTTGYLVTAPERTAPAGYREATSAMAPLMNAKYPIEKAIGRTERNNVLGLSNLLAGIMGGMATQSPWGASVAVLPSLVQNMPVGTALYRSGEQLPTLSSRLFMPATVRAANDEE